MMTLRPKGLMTSQPDDILRRVSAYYSAKVREFGPTPRGADWKDRESQNTRFEQLAKVTRGARSGSLAELGCGWGAFADWAPKHDFDLDYTGYDISDDMLAAAKARFKNVPRVSFRLGPRPTSVTTSGTGSSTPTCAASSCACDTRSRSCSTTGVARS